MEKSKINKPKRKILLFSMLLLLFSVKCFSQSGEADLVAFKKSLNAILYPYSLYSNCIPIATILKIDFDSSNKVIDFKLSDSADLLLKLELERVKSDLNKHAIENYAGYKRLAGSSLLIPLYFSPIGPHCYGASVKPKTLLLMMKFNNESFTGNCMIVPAYETTMAEGEPERFGNPK